MLFNIFFKVFSHAKNKKGVYIFILEFQTSQIKMLTILDVFSVSSKFNYT